MCKADHLVRHHSMAGSIKLHIADIASSQHHVLHVLLLGGDIRVIVVPYIKLCLLLLVGCILLRRKYSNSKEQAAAVLAEVDCTITCKKHTLRNACSIVVCHYLCLCTLCIDIVSVDRDILIKLLGSISISIERNELLICRKIRLKDITFAACSDNCISCQSCRII